VVLTAIRDAIDSTKKIIFADNPSLPIIFPLWVKIILIGKGYSINRINPHISQRKYAFKE